MMKINLENIEIEIFKKLSRFLKIMPSLKWNLEKFLTEAKVIHGDKYDYSQIQSKDIKNSDSKFIIICKKCNYEWSSNCNKHIYAKRGCLSCAGKLPWTLESFLKRAKEIHGEKINYTLITTQDIKGQNSHVPLICNRCKHQWSPRIRDHIHAKSGCPSCAGSMSWTYPTFLSTAKSIHGEKFDYSKVTPGHVKNTKSRIPLICNRCKYESEVSITNHISHESGCPRCAGILAWTLESFLDRAKMIHGTKIDYSRVESKHIKGCDSSIPLRCTVCFYEWSANLNAHIHGPTGCPNCSHNLPWTYEKFLVEAKIKHKDKFDYGDVTKEMFTGRTKESYIPIRCKTCEYEWQVSVANHMNSDNGCPKCSERIPWDLPRFLSKAKEIHRDNFDYSSLTNEDIKSINHRFIIICNKCKRSIETNILIHIHHECGCKRCRNSKGEEACERVLTTLKIPYEVQVKIESLPKKRFDFMFCVDSAKYWLEFDGVQHFTFNPFYHRTLEEFEKRKQIDILKTQHILQKGDYMIRLDYDSIDDIEKHIRTAIQLKQNLYLSDLQKYSLFLNLYESSVTQLETTNKIEILTNYDNSSSLSSGSSVPPVASK